jgi:hypothetical protein
LCYRLIIQSALKALQYAGVDELDKFLNSNYGSMRIGVQMSTSLEGTKPIKCGPMKTLHNGTCKYPVCQPSPKRGVARTVLRCPVSQHPPLLFRFSLSRIRFFYAHDACCIDVTLVASYHHLSLPPPSARLLPPRMEEIPKYLRRGGDLLLQWPAGARHQSTQR